MTLIRSIVLICLQENIVLNPKYIQGAKNIIADKLSRFLPLQKLTLDPKLAEEPTVIPENLRPESFVITFRH